MKINIIDEKMGRGKTQSIINYINDECDKNIYNKFIYITPYLNEVERIKTACINANFKEPNYINNDTKLNSLRELLRHGHNIVTTHALFHMFDDEIIELFYSQGYILIMDEVTDVVEPYDLKKDDIQILLKEFVDVKENGLLVWRNDRMDYDGDKFIQVKMLCINQSLALYNDKIMMWMFPIKIFEAFEESYILTYMFDAQMQKYYYDFYGLEYNYMYVAGNSLSTYHIVSEPQANSPKYNYGELINIVENPKLNRIGDINNSLSKTWYIKHAGDSLIKQLKNNTTNFFINITKSKKDDLIWTTFKDSEKEIKGNGYARRFVSCNARATNEYRNTHNVAYLVNRYFNPVLKQFFLSKGIEIHEDKYALSEMLQFIWRSAIRQGEPITVYIPSRRMRELLQDWIKNT